MTGVQTCALPILLFPSHDSSRSNYQSEYIYLTKRLYVHLRDKHGYQQRFLGANRKENHCKTRDERSTNTINVRDMGKPKIITRSYCNFELEDYQGQSIEERCKKMVETGEPIKDTSPLIYTPTNKTRKQNKKKNTIKRGRKERTISSSHTR